MRDELNGERRVESFAAKKRTLETEGRKTPSTASRVSQFQRNTSQS